MQAVLKQLSVRSTRAGLSWTSLGWVELGWVVQSWVRLG